MEGILSGLAHDTSAPKLAHIKQACQVALDILQRPEAMSSMAVWDVREKCLAPMQLALESRIKRLANHALVGIQEILQDERFQTSLEADSEEKWLPMQVLNTLYATPTLQEETQAEVMKLLLNMTLSTSWCMSAKIIMKVVQLLLDCQSGCGASSGVGREAATSLVQLLSRVSQRLALAQTPVSDLPCEHRQPSSPVCEHKQPSSPVCEQEQPPSVPEHDQPAKPACELGQPSEQTCEPNGATDSTTEEDMTSEETCEPNGATDSTTEEDMTSEETCEPNGATDSTTEEDMTSEQTCEPNGATDSTTEEDMTSEETCEPNGATDSTTEEDMTSEERHADDLTTAPSEEGQMCVGTYTACAPGVCSAVKASMTQTLDSFSERLRLAEHAIEEDGNDVLADFKMHSSRSSSIESVQDEVVAVLKFLLDKIDGVKNVSPGKQAIPLLLEGVQAMLINLPSSIRQHQVFQNLVWQQLCPALIWLLGSARAERSTLFQRSTGGEEVGRGSGLSASLPPTIVGPAAKNIYNIAAELLRLVGNTGSLRPVLESLFHRILLYPAPQYRHDALKVLQEVFAEKELVAEITAPLCWEPGEKSRPTQARSASTALIKLMVDSLQECSHCQDAALCHAAVGCVDGLLQSLEALHQGQGVSPSTAQLVLHQAAQHGHGHMAGLEEDGGSSQPTTPVSWEPVTPMSPVTLVTSVTPVTSVTEGEQWEPAQPQTPPASHPSPPGSPDVDASPPQELSDSDQDVDSDVAKVDVQASLLSRWDSEQAQEMSRRQRLLQDQFESLERQNARQCMAQLQMLLPSLLDQVSIQDVDKALQEFASTYCADLLAGQLEQGMEQACAAVVLNADGVYTASVAALSLTLRLHNNGFYVSQRPGSVPMSEAEFVEDVVGSALLVFLSPAWLTEVYRQVLAHDLLDCIGLSRLERAPLVALLKDLDGLGSHEERAQLLSQHQEEEEEEQGPQKTLSNSTAAGRRLACSVLRACWEGVLDVLAALLTGKNQQGISASLALLLGMEGAREDSLRARDAVCLSLNALQRAARLCSALGLQEPCSSVFALLAKTSCSSRQEERGGTATAGVEPKPSLKTVLPSKSRLSQLHAAHVLSLDVVMTTGLEMGSHSAKSWKHVFRCCEHISELEHSYFSQGNNQASLTQLQPGALSDPEPVSDLDSCEGDMYTGAVTPLVPVAPRVSVAELIRQSSLESGWDSALAGGSLLNHTQASRALCALSQEVDSFFEDAAAKLNLAALLSFLAELGEASRQQLRCLPSAEMEAIPQPCLPTNALLLYRLQHVLTNLVNSNRPLLHLLRAWAVIGPYLVEASAYRDWSISKMAVTCIHDFIVVMLSSRDERPHFHVNEFLCKTFEDILGLQLCDGDVQDQIVCSICELVEACSSQVQSGWRPLFGALRSVKIEYTASEEVNEVRQRHVMAVLDVFEVYLNTGNVFVFSNATVDCILCLLKYIHGSGMFEELSEDGSDSGSELGSSEGQEESLVLPALQYLRRCSELLASMCNMPACPVLKGAHRIQLSELRLVDTVLPSLNYEAFARSFGSTPEAGQDEGEATAIRGDTLSLDLGVQDAGTMEAVPGGQWHPSSLEQLDQPSGVLHVWFLLLDGLATAVSACPRHFQSQTLDCLFQLLHSLQDVPGPEFAVYCVNHLLLPMLQSWLRRGGRLFGYWDASAVNFKQCCGLTADLVVEHLQKFSGSSRDAGMLEFMLHQLFAVLIECIAQPVESLSRLGCSCIRHVLVSGGSYLTERMWQVGVQSLQRAVDVSSCPARVLMVPFHSHSDNFYGDIGHVKVATRKDCTLTEYLRMQSLAQQVFLLESQIHALPMESADVEDAKSYIFLLYPPSASDKLDMPFTRVPFRDIVLGLLSHQLLLQTIGFLLLEPMVSTTEGGPEGDASPPPLPGYLSVMSVRNIQSLLNCLDSSYRLACEFDARPGLKFLVQKVAGLEVAANLYKQAGASVVYYTNTLVKVCTGMPRLTLSDMHRVLNLSPDSWISDGKSSPVERKTLPETKGTEVNSSLPEDLTSSDLAATSSSDSTPAKSGPETSSCQNASPEKALLPKVVSETEEAPGSSPDKPQDAYVVEALSFRSRSWVLVAQDCQSSILSKPEVFLHLLQSVCHCLCQCYVDILADKTGTSCLDSMADQPLLFLIAQPDDLMDITRPSKSPGPSQESGAKDSRDVFSSAACPVDSQQETEVQAVMEEMVSLSSEDEEGHSAQCSKRELREEHNSKIYTIATDKLIKRLMTQYKQRKQQHSMPGFVKMTKRQPKKSSLANPRPSVDDAIDKQQRSSTMKDSEAHARSWAEMLCSVLQLFLELPAERFTALLPAVYPSLTQLVAHAQDAHLRDTLADWFAKLGDIHGFASCPSKPKGADVEEGKRV